MDVTVRVAPIEKLLDYVASGIGSIAGPMLSPWRAHREAEARRIAAKGDADAKIIRAEGDATALSVVVEAQQRARQQLMAPGVSLEGELTIAEAVEQRVRFQEEKRQGNISAIVHRAAAELPDGELEDHEPDHDWTARFFNDAQDVSSVEMQILWGRVLAGEVERPGSTSIRTLGVLRNLNQATASLFRRLCSVCVSLQLDEANVWDARVPSLEGNAAHNALRQYGLGFGQLNVLNEHGLIISDYNSWFDYRASIGLHRSQAKTGMIVIPFSFQGRYWILSPTTERAPDREFRLSGVALTRSGRELQRVVELEPMEDYAHALVQFFQARKLQVTKVENSQPRQVLVIKPSAQRS